MTVLTEREMREMCWPARPADARLRDEVAHAARYFDVHHPGWWQRITVPLEMHSCTRCIIGQVLNTVDGPMIAAWMWGDAVNRIFEGAWFSTNYYADIAAVSARLGFTPDVFRCLSAVPAWCDEIQSRQTWNEEGCPADARVEVEA